MRRRQFIGLVGSAAAWPVVAQAQLSGMPVVGFLSSLGRSDRPHLVEAFRRGLTETGIVENQNAAVEYRYAENQPQRLPALAADLVGRSVAVIVATGGGNSILAAQASTATTPIVFTFGGDPVMERFVASFNRPGGNITGISFFNNFVKGKALGLLHELVPTAKILGLFVNPNNLESARAIDAQDAARTLGWQLLVLNASTPSEIDTAFATLRQRRADVLLIGDPFYSTRRQQIVALAARDAIPAIYTSREFIEEGGLISYGNDISDVYRRAGIYAGRILKGEKPADLPVDQATKFEIVINLKTAKALGITVPPTLLARADEVIE
jgi:putative ABC transport system substrate-binding protein